MITSQLQVIKSLCKGCGVCAGVCPRDAIIMERDHRGLYTPSIDRAQCSQCMLCTRVCPAVPGCMEEMRPNQVPDTYEGFLLGPCIGSYAGYSLDKDLRYDAASGGIVTSLLLNALSNGDIDAALTVETSENDPFRACAIVTQNKQRILDAKGSKYLPVEFSAALRQIIRDGATRRVGIVGLPCHIEGIKRASVAIPSLRKKIVFTIGLFCKQTKDMRFTDLVLAKMGLERNQVRGIRFRGGGKPGYIQVTLTNGEIAKYPYEALNSLWGILSCSPVYCLLCSSPMAESADVSVGDAWLKEYQDDKIGSSVFFVRTEAGRKVVEQALDDQCVFLDAVAPGRILDAQPRFIVAAKKLNWASRLRVLRLFKRRVPDAITKGTPNGYLGGYLEFIWLLAIRSFSSSPFFMKVFPFIPKTILKYFSMMVIGVWGVLFRVRK